MIQIKYYLLYVLYVGTNFLSQKVFYWSEFLLRLLLFFYTQKMKCERKKGKIVHCQSGLVGTVASQWIRLHSFLPFFSFSFLCLIYPFFFFLGRGGGGQT